MNIRELNEAVKVLEKVKLFIRPLDDEVSWQAGAVSDRIKIRSIDSMKEKDGIVTLKSTAGTWMGDHVVYFSTETGSVSNDGCTWYAAGPKISIVAK